MARTTRTLNPLHFEDLEPHRFEDLVRQLAYGYKRWRSLEATGRLGKDQGLDIRGIEIVNPKHLGNPDGEDVGDDADPSAELPGDQIREWRIQVKRHKSIRPGQMEKIVGEAVPDATSPPHGLIIAAACDVSGQTLASFRGAIAQLGVEEGHVWSKAHLEDLLFRPENDHLLFAYFDISLRLRQRSRVQAIRSNLALKRKLLKALKTDEVQKTRHVPMLIRDVEDDLYPRRDKVPAFGETENAPWHRVEAKYIGVDCLVVNRFVARGWERSDGSWGILRGSRRLPPVLNRWDTYWTTGPEFGAAEDEPSLPVSAGRARLGTSIGIAADDAGWPGDVSTDERREITEVRLIPFENIVEVDPIGDAANAYPHLFCRFDEPNGPYGRTVYAGRVPGAHGSPKELDQSKYVTTKQSRARQRKKP